MLSTEKMTKSELRTEAYKYLKPNRIKHVAGCEKEAVRLAKKYGADKDAAARAAILHDITKKEDYDSQIELMRKYHLDCDDDMLASPQLLHAVTGAAFARDLFQISDEIYDAIRYHTTGKPAMTLLEKIIYLADYTEPSRDFDGVDKLRKVCNEDLDAAMALGLKMSIEDVREKGRNPYKDSLEAYEYYKTAYRG